MCRATRSQRAKPIDGQLPTSLIRLPESITAWSKSPRTNRWPRETCSAAWVPACIRRSGRPRRRCATADEREIALGDWQDETPLWLYILREAAVRGAGDHLGEVGGRIVAEVIVGIIGSDPESYLTKRSLLAADAYVASAGRVQDRDLLLPAR